MNSTIEFVVKNKEVYLEFLAGLKGFPFICDYSSHILGAYMAEHFEEEIGVSTGDYNENIHTWIELGDGAIVDFTLCQFVNEYSPKEVRYMKVNNLNLFNEFIVKNNIPLIVTEEDDYFDSYDFYDYLSIDDELIQIAKNTNTLADYLLKIEPYLKRNSLIRKSNKKAA